MPPKPLLLPYPRHLEFTEGAFSGDPFEALTDTVDADVPPQGYRLEIAPDGITLWHNDALGANYGRLTLAQLVRLYDGTIPAMVIDDSPDFARRGVMLDCSRDRVPNMATLYALIDKLSAWKINEFQLYVEHTFAYVDHQEVWAHASPFTPDEIRELDDYCRERSIDLVPCQSSLGHMERYLKHPRYLPLAEKPDGYIPSGETLPGMQRPPATLDPSDPRSLELVTGLFDELLPNFSSSTVNICGDEPFELGMGKNHERVAKEGGRVYLDYLLKLYTHVAAGGRHVQFWADIITQHPDLVPELPKAIIPLVWGYEADEPSEAQCRMVSASGLAFYVCPGTSSWNSLAGRTDNALGNLKTAARLGLQYGAVGYLNTDWGDNGHWQALPVSDLGFVYGAGMGWCGDSNADMDVRAILDHYAFEDEAGVLGRVAYELGNVYKLIPLRQRNSTWLFHAVQRSDAAIAARLREGQEKHGDAPLPPDTVRAAMARIEALRAEIDGARLRVDDALVKAEFKQAADLLLHGGKRLLRALGEPTASDAELRAELEGLVTCQRDLWLERSRPGGLEDSLARFDPALDSYQ